jgi:putative transposase
MPRANRVFVPGQVWHITHRCHQRDCLLQAQRDRRCWLYWLYEARKRFSLCVLNYIVTRNHVHLLVRDRGLGEIAAAMQLVASRTGQTYNERKSRLGAFWQDRYHATAVETEGHLFRCIAYIDLNMVRAGAVQHPREWRESGYAEMLRAPQRYRIIDMPTLGRLMRCDAPGELRARWIARTDGALDERPARHREPAWTESLAVGGEAFLQGIKRSLGGRATMRRVVDDGHMSCLREPAAAYALAPTVANPLKRRDVRP